VIVSTESIRAAASYRGSGEKKRLNSASSGYVGRREGGEREELRSTAAKREKN